MGSISLGSRLTVRLGSGAIAGASYEDGFDPLNINPGLTLSNSNKTATSTLGTAGNSGFACWSQTNKKIYFEVVCDTLAGVLQNSFGIYDLANPLLTTERMLVGESWATYPRTATTTRQYHDSAVTVTDYSVTNSDGIIYMLAYDLTTGKYWTGDGGTWHESGDPGAGTNPIWTDASIIGLNVNFGYSARNIGDVVTTAFDSADWTYSAPTGFTSPLL